MSISYMVYFQSPMAVSREEIASRCRDLHWAILMREPSAPFRKGKLVKPTGMLSHQDCYYAADSRRVSEQELEAAVMEDRWQVLWDTSGGEAIVSIDTNFDVGNIYDDDGLAELFEINAEAANRLKMARVEIEFRGGAYFVLQLSDAVARIGGGLWEDPQTGDYAIYNIG